MAGIDNESWINKYGTWFSIGLMILTFVYYGVIEGNTSKNKIATLESKLIEQSVKIDIVDNKKVDKETFIMIMNGQIEIKSSIEKTNSLLLEHILKGK